MTNHLHPATETIDGAGMGPATAQNLALTCIERRIRTAGQAGHVADHVAAEIEAMCRNGLSAGPGTAPDIPAVLQQAAWFIADETVRLDVQSYARGRRDEDGDWHPMARSMTPGEMQTIVEGCALIRSIEAVAGRLDVRLKWLRAVIDDPAWLAELPAGVVAETAEA